MKVAIAQAAPVFLDRDATLAKACDWVRQAANAGAKIVAFGETFAPAYPFWTARMDGSRWNADDQKDLHALYLSQGVRMEDLAELQAVCAEGEIACVIGVAERERTTLYASAVTILPDGEIGSVHRKLVPTFEEKFSWGYGDANGLVTHPLGGECVLGSLNCWENWMPLSRAAMYQQGMTVHVMLWPGSVGLTQDLTRFAAREGRTFVISASVLIRASDVPSTLPYRDQMIRSEDEVIQNGGSCIAGPDGAWVVEPVVGREELIFAELDLNQVLRERHNFDPAGHYSRPELLSLNVDTTRYTDA